VDQDSAAAAFSAIGQPTRLALMRLLLAAGPSGLTPGDLSAAMAVAPSTLSFHLRVLEQAGLAVPTRHGRHLRYAPAIAALRGAVALLADACCGGAPELCGDLATLFDQNPRGRIIVSTFNVLFLCTRNSARSIMAEAILDRIGRPNFEGHSAGSDPSPDGPLPEVLAQLASFGHDVSGLHSKSWHVFTGPDAQPVDFVITLCDTLNGQTCPDFGDTVITAAWPLPDPAKFMGSTAEKAALLNELYASLRRRLEIFISLPISTLDRMALHRRVEELADPKALT
jgi:ArsR family transcriptional regulator, arsenate/arsenite/antimonite-responsive transcriptional repressor / arsenate reductase (thioredoxin)